MKYYNYAPCQSYYSVSAAFEFSLCIPYHAKISLAKGQIHISDIKWRNLVLWKTQLCTIRALISILLSAATSPINNCSTYHASSQRTYNGSYLLIYYDSKFVVLDSSSMPLLCSTLNISCVPFRSRSSALDDICYEIKNANTICSFTLHIMFANLFKIQRVYRNNLFKFHRFMVQCSELGKFCIINFFKLL